MTTTSTDVWVFGYGSLAWRPGFEHAEAVQGFIKGYKRVFWQGSTGTLRWRDRALYRVCAAAHNLFGTRV